MHIPVLKDESIDGLKIQSGDIFVDCTLGGGGHTQEVIKRFKNKVKIIGLDLDSEAIDRVRSLISQSSSDVTLVESGFENIDKVLTNLKLASVDRILVDLGISSFQLDDSGRGFSFTKDEPLLMTMKKNPGENDISAREIVNTWDESTLRDIIYGFGEEKHSRKIARAIVEARKDKSIETTFDLVKIIEDAVGGYYKRLKIHPSTRTFQALRIATNSELVNLDKVIEKGWASLSKGGRLAIISFHSLEDRIVKRAFLKLKSAGTANIITKKPIIPTKEEIKINTRARSAKLRIIEKL